MVLMTAGRVIAALIHVLREVCPCTGSGPRYTQWTTIVYLPVAVMVVSVLLPTVDRIAFRVTRTGPFLSSSAANVLIAAKLIGVAIWE
jgi:hypothetical protein